MNTATGIDAGRSRPNTIGVRSESFERRDDDGHAGDHDGRGEIAELHEARQKETARRSTGGPEIRHAVQKAGGDAPQPGVADVEPCEADRPGADAHQHAGERSGASIAFATLSPI